jgi:hypothetical protein
MEMLLSAKNSVMETAVWHGALSSACNAWSHTWRPFPESFKDFPIKSLIDSLSWWQKFLVDFPFTAKNTWASIWFGFAHSRFLWTGRVRSVPLRLWRFVSGSYSTIHTIHHLWKRDWRILAPSQGFPQDQDTLYSDWTHKRPHSFQVVFHFWSLRSFRTYSRPCKKDVFHLNTCALISHSSGFAKLHTKFDGTTLLKLLSLHFRNAPHTHIFTSDALNDRIAIVANSNLYWVYSRA